MKHDRHHFVPFFAPLSTQKNEKNEKKTPGDIIILHKCTKTHDDTWKWKNKTKWKKKEKNHGDITSWSDEPWDGSWYIVHNK